MVGPAPAVAATRAAVRTALRTLLPAPPGRPPAQHPLATTQHGAGEPADPGVAAASAGATLSGRAGHGTAVGLDDGGQVLVACSGGPDSLALAAAAAFVAPRLGLRAGAVVVDHGLQTGSEQVAARAADQCRGLGLDPVLVRPVEVGTDGGPEAAARTARYAALDSAAAALGADVVLLGHTLDDQAEQVLLALARGSGARSLAGMPSHRGRYLRPFLGLRRATTVAACAAQGLDPWHDPTNTTGTGRRTRVRTEVMPLLTDVLGPGVTLALARTADQLRDAAEAVDSAAATLLAQGSLAAQVPEARTDDGAALVEGLVEMPVEALAQAPAAVRRAALRAMAVAAGSPGGSLGVRHVAALEALVVSWHGQGPVHLPGPVLARRDCGRLRVEPAARRTGPRPTSTPVDTRPAGTEPTSTGPTG